MMLSDQEIQEIRNRAKLNDNRQIEPMAYARAIDRAALAKASQQVQGDYTPENVGNELHNIATHQYYIGNEALADDLENLVRILWGFSKAMPAPKQEPFVWGLFWTHGPEPILDGTHPTEIAAIEAGRLAGGDFKVMPLYLSPAQAAAIPDPKK